MRTDIFLLAICQALFMTTSSAIIASTPLIGLALVSEGNTTLVTLPLALQFIGMMTTAMPASLYMRRVGRKLGFLTGGFIGVCGTAIGVAAIIAGSFPLFCLASLIIGSFKGFCHYFRFAAADVASEQYRSRAISLVLAGGVVAAFTGPNLAIFTKDLISAAEFAGIYASMSIVCLAAGLIPLLVNLPPPVQEETTQPMRPLGIIMRQPKFIIAVIAVAFGYVVMSFLMSATPLAMSSHGFVFGDSAFVIQAHILGMYVPAFFTGHLVQRFGIANILLAGTMILVVSIGLNLTGVTFAHFLVSLILLGLGWNFLFVGGTILLTSCYEPHEKTKAQGMNEVCVWTCVALAAFSSGVVHSALGWEAVNLTMAPFAAAVFISVLWLRFRPRALEA